MNINPSLVFILALLDLPQRLLCHCEWGVVVCVLYLRRVQRSLLSLFCLLLVSVHGTPMTSLLLIHIQINLRKTSPVLSITSLILILLSFWEGSGGNPRVMEEAGNLRPDLSSQSSSFPGNFGLVQYSSRHLLGDWQWRVGSRITWLLFFLDRAIKTKQSCVLMCLSTWELF